MCWNSNWNSTLNPQRIGASMKKLLSLIAAGFAFSLSLSPLAQAADSPAKQNG
jgi:hypothetical protein